MFRSGRLTSAHSRASGNPGAANSGASTCCPGSPLSRGRAKLGCAILALIVLPGDGRAQKADLEYGRYLATECLTCHRRAQSAGAIANIFGIAQPRFITRVKADRDERLPNEVMQTIAGRLKDDEIEALAHYFAVTKRP